MPFGGLAYEERSQDECHQNKSPKSYSVTPSSPCLPRLDVHTVRAVAVWSLKGPQGGKKLAEADGAEMILTPCHRSSLLHALEACKVNRCSFKRREIRVRTTKQIWCERLPLVDLQGLSQVEVPSKSAQTFRLRTNIESHCLFGLFSRFSGQCWPICVHTVHQTDNRCLMSSLRVEIKLLACIIPSFVGTFSNMELSSWIHFIMKKWKM